MSRRYIHGSQAPADCEVFGQDDRTVTRGDILWGLAAAIGLCGMGYFLSYIGAL